MGEVVVFKIKDRDIPIVHRVMKVHEKASGAVELLTKGDNNRVDDRGLYAPGQLWLERDDVLGRAVGTLRYVGMVTIILNDYPALKYVLVSIMGLFVPVWKSTSELGSPEKYCVDHRTDAVTATTSRQWPENSTPSTRRPFSLIDLRAGGRGRRLQD